MVHVPLTQLSGQSIKCHRHPALWPATFNSECYRGVLRLTLFATAESLVGLSDIVVGFWQVLSRLVGFVCGYGFPHILSVYGHI